MDLFSRKNTQALKGFAAIGIFVFHILLGYDISPLFNMWGGFFVTVFLILSGYGIEESFQRNGLDDYWRKRADKVLLPTAFFICTYNFIFPHLIPESNISSGAAMHKCLDELLYISPTFWFVFFILKCYTVYWIGTRFMGERLRLFFFVVCALLCLNTKSPCGHLEAEQSFSFFAGVLLSVNKRRVEALSDKQVMRFMFLLLFVGVFFFCLKSVPMLHKLKGRIAYHYLLCPFRLTIGLAFIPLLTKLRLKNFSLMRTLGQYSLEIYVAHIPFIGMIADVQSTAVFFACSILSFILLLAYRTFVEKKLSLTETLFIVVNVIFVAKYSVRFFESFAFYAIIVSVIIYYVLLRFVIPYFFRNISSNCLWRVGIGGICSIAILSMGVIQYSIDPYTLQVDRWSALQFPIQNLLSGIYPYGASTHLGGNASPFPVWQILHIPFYLMGNVGLSFFVTMALFLWSCWKVQGKEKAFVICLLLCSSIAVWYEVIVRSDLITNFLLLATIINFSFNHLNQQWVEKRRWWIAYVVGLLASTRLLVLIPITILLLPFFIRMRLLDKMAVTLLMLLIFSLTFLPFALWDWQEFYYYQNNPWALQTGQGHLSDFIIFIPLAIFLAMNHKGKAIKYYRNTAMMLFSFISITFVHNMYVGENWNLFSSAYDITYLSTVLPFCLLNIGEKTDEKIKQLK